MVDHRELVPVITNAIQQYVVENKLGNLTVEVNEATGDSVITCKLNLVPLPKIIVVQNPKST